MISPTIGRRVWYWPNSQDRGQDERGSTLSIMRQDDLSQPCDAGVAYVWHDRMVNLTVADQNGVMHSRRSVKLLQDDESPFPGEAYAEWMPYQAAQAKKHESEEVAKVPHVQD